MLLFAGSVQFLLGLVVAEEVYPDYRVSQTISSLGMGSSALIFNTSLFLEGALVVAAACFLHLAYHRVLVSTFFAVGGIGAMGGALFPQDVVNVHLAISVVSFFVAGLTPFVTLRLQMTTLHIHFDCARSSLIRGCYPAGRFSGLRPLRVCVWCRGADSCVSNAILGNGLWKLPHERLLGKRLAITTYLPNLSNLPQNMHR